MDKNKNPLMLAYIIFLGASIIYYFISEIYNLEYEIWSKIIIAATTASYYFAISSMTKSTLDIELFNIDFTEERIILLKEQLDLLNCLENVENKIMKTEKFLNKVIKTKKRFEKSINGTKRYVFSVETGGFIAFLFPIGFSPVYDFLKQHQDVYTLVAFFTIMAVDYFNPLIKENLGGLNKRLNDSIKKENDKLRNKIDSKLREETTHGQT